MTPDDKSTRRFTPDEINDILRRALERQTPTHGVTYTELLETAHELGIDPSVIDSAIDDQRRRGSIDTARTTFLTNRKAKFMRHLRSYAIVNGFLFVLWLLTSGLEEPMWFLWVSVCWGVGLAFDAADTFYPNAAKVDRGARRIVARQQQVEDQRQKDSMKHIKRLSIDAKARKVVIEKGDKRIEIG